MLGFGITGVRCLCVKNGLSSIGDSPTNREIECGHLAAKKTLETLKKRRFCLCNATVMGQ